MATQNHYLNDFLEALQDSGFDFGQETQNYQPNDLLDTDDAAPVIRSKPRTMIRWRGEGTGPDYCKIGRKVLYRYSSLLRWIEAQEVTPVREPRK